MHELIITERVLLSETHPRIKLGQENPQIRNTGMTSKHMLQAHAKFKIFCNEEGVLMNQELLLQVYT